MFKNSINEIDFFTSRIKLSKEIEKQLLTETVGGYRQKHIGKVGDYEINLLFTSDKPVPVLATPVILEGNTKSYILIDARPFVSKINKDDRFEDSIDYKVKNLPELNQQVQTAILMGMWKDNNSEIFNSSLFAMEAMTKLVSGTLMSRLGLDLETALRIETLVGLMYIANSIDDVKLLKDEVFLAGKLKRISKQPLATILNTITEDNKVILENGKCVDPMSTVMAISDLNNPRLGKLELVTVLNLLSNISSFYGFDKRMVISLMFPPVWLPLVYGGITDKRHKRSYFATRVSSVTTRNQNLEPFEKFMESIYDYVDYDKTTGK